ncbi:MAG: Eco57I restriction-modification methylase domain-containing protein [Solirubrobacteraceae bacterium]
MARLDPQIQAHLEWLGFVAPTGLVVSAPALVRAGAILDRNDAVGQRLLRDCATDALTPAGDPEPIVDDFEAFARSVLGWTFSPKGYAGMAGTPIPPELEVALADYGETLRPDYAVLERDPKDGAPGWQLVIRVLGRDREFDESAREGGQLDASAHGRMERLLRETGVPAGVLFNGRALRLISAPRGESSGWIEFRVADMVLTAGRPILAALRMLLRESRLLTLPRAQRLAALLEDSRRFQNEVSEKLAAQVLHALYELLRGFQAADDAAGGELLRRALAEHPDEVYHALLTVILRLLFVLYAEERGMLPSDSTYVRYYSVAQLYDRLRADAAGHPDTMEQRYGAWAQLLVVFRMIHDGAKAGALSMPARRGVLFDPDRYKFLEGRSGHGARSTVERIEPPLVPDGTIHRALEKLLVLDGERISYRALDVEQIGSVYETMMGFRLETATGRSVAIKAHSRHGAPTAVDLDALLDVESAKRAKWLADRADRKLTPKVTAAVKAAESVEDLQHALAGVVDTAATPDLVPAGSMILQPSEERRRSGSHYTPRALTEPIVRTTLEPILGQLRGEDGGVPRPAQILDLKVCDPAMGSGAFLVEACRQLADQLVEAWGVHGGRPEIPADEDERVFARRLVAQRCLYGVDRNPVAVDLAKMSLWLITLAREHALTFVDHALRYGDSLVGLSRRQIESFNWSGSAPGFEAVRIGEHVARAAKLRAQIRGAGEDVSDFALREMWGEAQDELQQVRLFGDLVVAAFFAGTKPKEREAKRVELAGAVAAGQAESWRWLVDETRHAAHPIVPFHWEIEFPEVFEEGRGGFDAIVGNPPFGGHVSVVTANAVGYAVWLRELHERSAGKCDLVAHFFRRVFGLLRPAGTFGLIATNTVGQGDTRNTGIHWICSHGGEIYEARRRLKWPGMAAVVVSVVHVEKARFNGVKWLDGRRVEHISAFLFHRGGDDEPARLGANAGKSFIGSLVLGMGFTFDDTDTKGVASRLADVRRLIEADPRNEVAIFPYLGGEEVNTSPLQAHHRYVIDLGKRDERECWERWPLLMGVLQERVRPERIKSTETSRSSHGGRAATWWQHYHLAEGLRAAASGMARVLVIARVGQQAAFVFLDAGSVFSEQLVVFPLPTCAAFCALQSRPHEVWARFFGSSMKDDLRYTPSDCFETFAFPDGWESDPALEAAGDAYYALRAALMIEHDEGLTKTYNRFHDPYNRDPGIERLRELHSDMDRAVLHAYGWDDIPTDCEFLLDYEIDEEEWGTKRKPYRYRWPDEVRDEVLGRLIELNSERAAEEQRSGAAAHRPARRATARPGLAPETGKMF